jgi:C-terminal processing protease CtpA/Prc
VDARLNGGGDNTSYGPLLAALRARSVNRPGRLVLLTGRVTFSAGGNFAAEVDAFTRARIVGEPAGGSPHNYGDSTLVELPTLGWTVYVPPEYVEVLGRVDEPVALEPDVAVQIGAADHFAGRDPVLAKAIPIR